MSALPGDLDASIFIVQHSRVSSGFRLAPPWATKLELKAAFATDGEPILRKRIYIAPPDYHMTLKDSTVQLERGPKENFVRPAIDPLFRSAASEYGPRVIGVILSGGPGDGAAGLYRIKQAGGKVFVQDPSDAEFSAMPLTALEYIHPDFRGSAREIGLMLSKLGKGGLEP